MRRSWFVGAAVLALAASPAIANEFQDLRDREPAIDAAIASMPSSGITGTLNRISIQADQPNPSKSFEDRMVKNVETLEAQLRDGLPYLSLAERLVLAQVVQIVVIDDLLVHQGGGGGIVLVPCPPDEGGGVSSDPCPPAVERALDVVAEQLEGSIREAFDSLAIENPDVVLPTPPAAPAGGIGAASFGGWLDEVLEDAAGVIGVESWDY